MKKLQLQKLLQVREQEGMKAAQRLFSGTTVWSLGFCFILLSAILRQQQLSKKSVNLDGLENLNPFNK